MKEEILVGSISLVVGVMTLVFRKSFAFKIIEFQNSVWGFHFGKTDIKIAKFVIVIVGIGAILFGLLSLFQIIRFK